MRKRLLQDHKLAYLIYGHGENGKTLVIEYWAIQVPLIPSVSLMKTLYVQAAVMELFELYRFYQTNLKVSSEPMEKTSPLSEFDYPMITLGLQVVLTTIQSGFGISNSCSIMLMKMKTRIMRKVEMAKKQCHLKTQVTMMKSSRRQDFHSPTRVPPVAAVKKKTIINLVTETTVMKLKELHDENGGCCKRPMIISLMGWKRPLLKLKAAAK
jgi:hypothetical protein